MKSFKQYLFHRIKATWILTAVLCLFAIIITATTVKVYNYTYWEMVYNEMGEPTKEEVLRENVRVQNLGTIFYILCGFCSVVPVLELSGLKNKRNADTIYSLPIDRRKMGAAHFTNGFLQILAVYLCMAVTASIPLIKNGAEYLHLQFLPPLMLLPIPAALLLYAYYSYLFNEANSTVDGCLFIASGTFMPLILYATCQNYSYYENGVHVSTILDKIDELAYFPYFPIIKIVDVFDGGLRNLRVEHYYDGYDILMITVWCVIGLLAALGFYFTFDRKRVENIGNISSSWVGYKTSIPLCMFAITSLVSYQSDLYLVVICAVVAVIGYMLYRKSFKLKWYDFASIGGGIAAAIVCRMIEGISRYGGGSL